MRLGKLRVPLQYAILTWWLSPHYYFEIETEIAAPSRTLLKTRASAYLPHKADINCRDGDFRFVPTDVRFVPTRDSCTAANSILDHLVGKRKHRWGNLDTQYLGG